MGWYRQWAPYKPVAQRRREGEQKAKKLLKKGQSLSPIKITGRGIATTFWGKAWCEHLERYSDFANRLPRGRTYARNGSIVDLQIEAGKITSLVCGSDLYKIVISIQQTQKKQWKDICSDCAHSIGSVIDLMRGKLSDEVIRRLTDPTNGMFPKPNEIRMSCSCPDGARLCKHLAAVLYGVGHRLDSAPELLFVLRGVAQDDLVCEAISSERVTQAMGLDGETSIATEDLGSIFGIELTAATEASPAGAFERRAAKTASKKKPSKAKSKTKPTRDAAKAKPKKPAKKAK